MSSIAYALNEYNSLKREASKKPPMFIEKDELYFEKNTQDALENFADIALKCEGPCIGMFLGDPGLGKTAATAKLSALLQCSSTTIGAADIKTSVASAGTGFLLRSVLDQCMILAKTDGRHILVINEGDCYSRTLNNTAGTNADTTNIWLQVCDQLQNETGKLIVIFTGNAKKEVLDAAFKDRLDQIVEFERPSPALSLKMIHAAIQKEKSLGFVVSDADITEVLARVKRKLAEDNGNYLDGRKINKRVRFVAHSKDSNFVEDLSEKLICGIEENKARSNKQPDDLSQHRQPVDALKDIIRQTVCDAIQSSIPR